MGLVSMDLSTEGKSIYHKFSKIAKGDYSYVKEFNSGVSDSKLIFRGLYPYIDDSN